MAASIGPNVDLAPLVDHDRHDHDDRLRGANARWVRPGRGAQIPLLDEARDALDERLLVGVRRLATVQGRDDALVDVDAR